MRTLPFVLTACCISLFSAQLLALRAAQERGQSQRLDLVYRLFNISKDISPLSRPPSPPPAAAAPFSKWLTFLVQHRSAPPDNTHPVPPSEPPSLEKQKTLPSLQLLRMRRHLSSRGTHHLHHHSQHAQLMRVGCVLGTCQVQNLSHRLYQLIGQSGREDSSPINPKSPHSYG